MIRFMYEITDEVSLADGATIYISVHRWSKRDKVPCLGAQIVSHNTTPLACDLLHLVVWQCMWFIGSVA